MLPSMMREDLYMGILSNDIIGFHTRSYRRNFLQCCEDLLGFEVDFGPASSTSTTARSGSAPTRCRSTPTPCRRWPRVRGRAQFEDELLRRRRDHLILRVDRADLSKNVLRGFSAFDVFLEQHPEFRENVTFIAQLMPSRTDVPEYAEYLERIEAVVAVVNHRHGSPDWMPIQLKLRDDLEEAVAAYKHYDVLMVNAMFDGMNLVAKEGPMVNERAGRLDPVREHRRARGARRVRAVGQPVRHPGAGRLDPRRADDAARGARAATRGPAVDRHRPRPGRLDRRAARGHPQEGTGRPGQPRSLSVERLSLAQHRDEALDPLGAGLGSLGLVDAVEERVAVLAPQRREELACGGVAVELALEVLGHGGPALRRIGGLPAPVGLGGLHLVQAGRAHPPLGDQPLGLLAVDLRPPAPRPAGGEALEEEVLVVGTVAARRSSRSRLPRRAPRGWATLGMPEAFLAIFSQTPGSRRCLVLPAIAPRRRIREVEIRESVLLRPSVRSG